MPARLTKTIYTVYRKQESLIHQLLRKTILLFSIQGIRNEWCSSRRANNLIKLLIQQPFALEKGKKNTLQGYNNHLAKVNQCFIVKSGP